MAVLNAGEIAVTLKQGDEAQDLERAAEKIVRRISAEPGHKAVLYRMLKYCASARTGPEVEHYLRSFPGRRGTWQSALVLLGWLAEAGGIEPIGIDEQEKKGEQERLWRTTPAGLNALGSASDRDRLVRLLAREALYHDIYLQVLEFCAVPRSRTEIDELLKGNPVLEQPKVYPSFLIEALEEAGGLEWDGQWKTTQDGKDFLHQERRETDEPTNAY